MKFLLSFLFIFTMFSNTIFATSLYAEQNYINETNAPTHSPLSEDNISQTDENKNIEDIEKETIKKINDSRRNTAEKNTGANKGYKIYVEEEAYIDTFPIPGDNIIYLIAYAGLAIPVVNDNYYNSNVTTSFGAGAGAIFKKYIGAEVNLSYLKSNYSKKYDEFSHSRGNKGDSEQLNLKLYVTGNLPFTFEHSKLVPYIAAGFAINFTTLYWYESFNSPVMISYDMKRSSYGVSVGPVAKVGARYMYKKVVFELNIEYVYSYHSDIKNQNLSYIATNFGFGFAF